MNEERLEIQHACTIDNGTYPLHRSERLRKKGGGREGESEKEEERERERVRKRERERKRYEERERERDVEYF
jgi:hypothetical protein